MQHRIAPQGASLDKYDRGCGVLQNGNGNKIYDKDRPIHDWYRFVLSYPPHLVRSYLESFQVSTRDVVLDPFCGTGTTLVECQKLGVTSIGIEANPMAQFASKVKVDWSPDPALLMEHAKRIAVLANRKLAADGIEDDPIFPSLQAANIDLGSLRTLPSDTMKLLLTNSISPLPLHKALVLLDCIDEQRNSVFHDHELLALAKCLVLSISNLQFGPEVGVGKPKLDAPVISTWLSAVRAISNDLACVPRLCSPLSRVMMGDAREIVKELEPNSIGAIITSPPYPNEKDYTRTTRLESVLLGFITDRKQLAQMKHGLVRSNTRGVYKDDSDDVWVSSHIGIQQLADSIETRRIQLGKTSGFERMYARVTRLYFGGMARHLSELRPALKPGAKLAYVVGDQASYLRVMIRTGQILAEIAQSLGYEVDRIDLFRTRLATATREQLREEVVVLRWAGT